MNALELADYLDSDESLTNRCTEAAAMLRAQHAAIRQLREALTDIAECSDDLGAIECANEALAATEECK